MKRFVLIAAATLCLLTAGSDEPRLNFKLIECEETPIVAWKLISTPPTENGWVTASGGTGSIPIICYCGRAYSLNAEGLSTNAMLIEASTNLCDWQPFPAPGFQLTFYTNSQPFTNVPEDRMLFFRGIIQTNEPR